MNNPRLIVICAMAAAMPAPAQTQGGTAKAQPASSYSGCLTAISAATQEYVLASAGQCYYVQSASAAKAAAHEITVRAVLVPQQGNAPVTLELKGPVAVGAACSQTCQLQPPGTRGLGPHDHPGPQGSTQGVAPQPSPQP